MCLATEMSDLYSVEGLIAERLGMRVDDDLRRRLSEVMDARLRKLRLTNPDDYLTRLRAATTGPEELRILAQGLTIGETYFFRGQDHYQAFVETVLPERLRERAATRTLNVLSAACASGEEPYTLAMLLREAIPDLDSWRINILGVDINGSFLDKARKGVYAPWSLREIPAAMKQRHLKERGGNFLLDPVIRDMVRFEERNLLEDGELWRSGYWDVIFCRNMLIYFTLDAMTAVLNRIERALAPGGYLFVGHSESLRGITLGFHLRNTHETFYYQVLGADEPRPGPSLWDPVVTQDLWNRPAEAGALSRAAPDDTVAAADTPLTGED